MTDFQKHGKDKKLFKRRKMKYIILDTETTGALAEDRICQLSYLVLNESFEIEEVQDNLCIPPLEIKFDSMAIHHITPEQLIGKPTCKESKAFQRLNELNIPENIMVIQNAKFDLDMLLKEEFVSQMRLVDTFQILRAKYSQDTPHGLQHKRYQWGLYTYEQAIIDKLNIEVKAHDALGDVIVLKNLFDKLVSEHSVDEMTTICLSPILLDIMPFGKNKGKSFEYLVRNQRNDLQYMLDKFDLDDDLLYTINYHMKNSKDNIILTLGFGKYKGKTPSEVVEHDRNYLEWMRDKAENISQELKDEIIKVLG